MATKADFSHDEWMKVIEAPMLAGVAISMLDMGVISFAKEFSAMLKAVIAAKNDYAGNPLVQAVIADFETTLIGRDINPDIAGHDPASETAPELKSELKQVYEPEIDRLEEMLGRDLSAWRNY